MPKATSSPFISDEQRERMMQNRRFAEERRVARLKNSTFNSSKNSNTEASTSIHLTSVNKNVDNQNDAQNYKGIKVKKAKKSFVIDSDDDDDDSNSTHSNLKIDSTQNKDNGNATETSIIGYNTNDINLNSRSNVVSQKEAIEFIDITEGYEFRNDETNHKINEIINLVNTEVQDTNIIRNSGVNSSDDECAMNSVNVSITVDVHKGNRNNIDIIEENDKEILKKSGEISDEYNEQELSENKNQLLEDIPNETEMSKEAINTNQDNTIIYNENVSNLNENASSQELGTIDEEITSYNVAQSVGVDDLMDVDFCNDF